MRNIWWIRRDIRLRDQESLRAAASSGEVVPLFILDPALIRRAPARRLGFMLANLDALNVELRKRGSRLIVRAGRPAQILPQIASEIRADAVFAEEDFSPYARRRDAAVARACNLHVFRGGCVHHPTEILKKDQSPYVVYSAYARVWKQRLPAAGAPIPAPDRLQTPTDIASEELPRHSNEPLFPAGEEEAGRRLETFLREKIHRYGRERDRMDLEGTSALSPYLRFGVLSVRAAVGAALRARAGAIDAQGRESAEKWLNEWIWREFYTQVLYHFPHVVGGPFRRDLSGVRWTNRQDWFERWKAGETGVPVVDAGMRQLRETGWMHNRARMITASFLVKDLLLNWQWGERWFMQNLIDGDVSSNNGGWQWTAGTGTDAAPYFRIFNPVTQGRKFDPNGDYVRRWVTELVSIPPSEIHAPWEKGTGIAGYPRKPMVDHAEAVRRTRLAYDTARDTGNEKRNP